MATCDPLEEEDTNVIIDCDILEAAKENIQPLARGRRVTALASVLATPAASRDARLEATRSRMRERVREARDAADRAKARESEREGAEQDDESEDEEEEELTLEEASELLLDTYVRFVTWTVEHYPKGQSAHSGILELLEEATRVLRQNTYARQDPRYLNLWIRYAGYVEKQELIYEFLLANDIGTDWGKLYEEYATVLERSGRRTKADEIYVLGVSRRAEPLDHLERRHREFQKRMMVAASAPGVEVSIPDSSSGSQPSSALEAPRRRILGDTTPASAPQPLQEDVFAVPSASRSTIASSISSASQPHSNGRMPVFLDPEGTAADPAGRSAWPELGTRAERVKENVRTKEKMSGTTLKQKGAAKAATRSAAEKARAGPKIVPFRDADTSSEAPTKQKSALPSAAARNGKAKLVPFKDVGEPSVKRTVTSSKPASSKAKIVPFKDTSTSESAKAEPSTSKSKIMPFKDPDPIAETGSKAPFKAPFKPFIDCADDDGDDEAPDVEILPPKAPKTPLFVPFKDEDAGESASQSQSSLLNAMRPKMLGEKDPGSVLGSGLKMGLSSEVEALRKDPFKNYAKEDL